MRNPDSHGEHCRRVLTRLYSTAISAVDGTLHSVWGLADVCRCWSDSSGCVTCYVGRREVRVNHVSGPLATVQSASDTADRAAHVGLRCCVHLRPSCSSQVQVRPLDVGFLLQAPGPSDNILGFICSERCSTHGRRRNFALSPLRLGISNGNTNVEHVNRICSKDGVYRLPVGELHSRVFPAVP